MIFVIMYQIFFEIIPFIPKSHWTWCFFPDVMNSNIYHLSASFTCQQLSNLLCFDKSKTKQRVKRKHVVTYYARQYFSPTNRNPSEASRCEASNVVNSKPPLCVPDANLQRQKWFESVNSMSFFFKISHGAFILGSLKPFPFFSWKCFRSFFMTKQKRLLQGVCLFRCSVLQSDGHPEACKKSLQAGPHWKRRKTGMGPSPVQS